MIRFPSLEEALELHQYIIERFGGSNGVRDLGLLESALHRPQSGYYEDILTMASALMESLLINHPFVDGNKRVAFFLTDVFLRLNGWKIRTEPSPGYDFIRQVLSDETERFKRIQAWLQEHVIRL